MTYRLICPFCEEENTFLVWSDYDWKYVCEDCFIPLENRMFYWGA